MVKLDDVRRRYQGTVCTEFVGFSGASNIPDFTGEPHPVRNELWHRLLSKLGFGIRGGELSSGIDRQRFAEFTAAFIKDYLAQLGPSMIGEWITWTVGKDIGMDSSSPDRTLLNVQEVLGASPQLGTELRRYCLIAPDIIVAKRLRPENLAICEMEPAVQKDRLRGVISCNWTVCSDADAQASHEVLNLIPRGERRTSYVMAVTFEPLPTRLAFVALGTADLDCLYHVALRELVEVIEDVGSSDHKEVIRDLVQGHRLRDISDLPLDLAI